MSPVALKKVAAQPKKVAAQPVDLKKVAAQFGLKKLVLMELMTKPPMQHLKEPPMQLLMWPPKQPQELPICGHHCTDDDPSQVGIPSLA